MTLQAVPRVAPLELALLGLSQLVDLTEDECNEVRSLSRLAQTYNVGASIRSMADGEPRIGLILSGWACELRILVDGRRQIFSFLMPGDTVLLDCGSTFDSRSIIGLTRVDIIDINSAIKVGERRGGAGLAALAAAHARRNERRRLDQITRLGQLSAYERVVHLLLELRARLAAVGLVDGYSFRLPLTQENFADALGLSIVHVNRTLQHLRREGLIELKSGGVALLKPRALFNIAGLSASEELIGA